MRLARLQVRGLFDQLHHDVSFGTSPPGEARPSVTILHGPNGIGKTTMLTMLAGIMRLDFNIFRSVPFESCSLEFEGGHPLSVEPVRRKSGKAAISVTFKDHSVILHPVRPGALQEADNEKIEAFRADFTRSTSDLSLELIDTRRLLGSYDRRADAVRHLGRNARLHAQLNQHELFQYDLLMDGGAALREPINPKAIPEAARLGLADRVSRFIADAQVNYRQFFAVAAPDMFARLLASVSTSHGSFTRENLEARLSSLAQEDERISRLGLAPIISGYEQLSSLLQQPHQAPTPSLLAMAGAFIELLEAKTDERKLLADRLLRFEQLVNRFFFGKTLRIDSRSGFEIVNNIGRPLTEFQLSSGEYHLLYLLVSALIVRRAGTVMAIDEPEMSMHISWQRQLVRALSECAAGAEPQFILATHSPDVAADFSTAMIELSAHTSAS